ncbi:MAG: hypothetical protein DRR19_13435 [Candidatus Parabeggiatoa sp. nov. 1]|nr:MAG: hypothetical protein DRR19_13435 [Gammaproteobacteria bacterium]
MIYSALDSILFWLWFLLIIGSTYYLMRTTQQDNISVAFKGLFSYRLLLPVLVIVAISSIRASLIFIPPSQVGVVISFISENGVRDKPIKAGRRWLVPWLEEVVFYPIGLQTYTMSGKSLEGQKIGDDSITARTKDGKEVHVDCSIIFKIDSDKVIELHKMWQDRYVDEFVRPVLRSVIRTEISQYTVTDVNGDKRRKMETAFKTNLERIITKNGLVFDAFFLRNLAFSDKYVDSIEMKQLAEAEAEAEAKAIVIKAKAEAQAQAILKGEIPPQSSLISSECRCKSNE